MAHNIKPRICVICGKSYKPTSSTQKCCSSECKKTHRKAYKRKIKTAPPRKNTKSELVAINRLAHESGMTYGQYMAEQYKKARNENGKIDKQ